MSTKLAGVEGDVSKEKLMHDLRVVVTDAEELLRATAGQAGEKVAVARERIQDWRRGWSDYRHADFARPLNDGGSKFESDGIDQASAVDADVYRFNAAGTAGE